MNSEQLLAKATDLKEASESQLQIANDLKETGKSTGVTLHFKGYSIGAKSYDGFDFKSIVDFDALSAQFKKESDLLKSQYSAAYKEYESALATEKAEQTVNE